MDLPTKVAIGLFLLGGATWLFGLLFADDLKVMSGYARGGVFSGGMIFISVGLLVLACWPVQKPASNLLPAKIEIAHMEIILPTKDRGLLFNIHLRNSGQQTAGGLQYLKGVIATPSRLTSHEEDVLMKDLDSEHFVPGPATTDMIEPNDGRLITVGDLTGHHAITLEEFAKMQVRHRPLYLFLILKYLDASSETIWVTEYCQYFYPGSWSAPHMCSGHNQIYNVGGAN